MLCNVLYQHAHVRNIVHMISLSVICLITLIRETYNSLVVVGPARVSGSDRGRAFLSVPGGVLML